MIKKILYGFIALVVLTIGLSYTPAFAHLRNFAKWGKHSIYDYKTHPTRLVKAASVPQYWPLDSAYNKAIMPDSLMLALDSNDTHAFLVIQNGKIVYEKYFDGYNSKTLSGSFSAAKSIISLLIGIALQEGKIKSLEEPVGNYVPHFKESNLDKIKIIDLLTMSSGTNYQEFDKSYFSLNAYGYYGDNEEYMVNKMKFKEPSGAYWDYRSGDTQVLGLIVEKAFGDNISNLVSQRFLQPMGAEVDALWLLDGDQKHEKAFCCFNGVARDYARFGQLILNKGAWGGIQIVDSNYISKATSPASYLKDRTESDKPVDYYGYQYWIVQHKGMSIPFQNGLFGQYVFSIKEKNAVVVRLGESKTVKHVHHYQPEIYSYLDAALSVLK
jgi:CubicO group peptidase (beta-lactamase class C family)